MNISVDPERHRQWKVAAAQSGRTVKQFVQDACDAEAERVEKKQRPRKQGGK